MGEEEEFPFWRKRRFFFSDIFREVEKMFEEFFKEIERDEFFPRELIKEKKIGTRKIKEYGPFVYGYSIRIGPDGKPEIREFGNIRPTRRITKPIEVSKEREPLVDIIEEKDKIRVVAEVPGVKKEDINLTVEDNRLIISTAGERKYYKEVELTSKVEPDTSKATYTNGILEVVLTKKEKPKGIKKIKIE